MFACVGVPFMWSCEIDCISLPIDPVLNSVLLLELSNELTPFKCGISNVIQRVLVYGWNFKHTGFNYPHKHVPTVNRYAYTQDLQIYVTIRIKHTELCPYREQHVHQSLLLSKNLCHDDLNRTPAQLLLKMKTCQYINAIYFCVLFPTTDTFLPHKTTRPVAH